MAYCAVCGRNHETGAGCFNGTAEILDKAGMNAPQGFSHEKFRQIAKKADRWFLRLLLWALVLIVLIFLVSSLAIKTY